VPLKAVVLKPSQVGPGYVAREFENGHTVRGQVTLELCGRTFASESLRVARLELAYMHPAPAPFISNEVVRYRAGGAGRAMSELRHVASHCRSGAAVNGPVAGSPAVKHRLRQIRDSGLVREYLAVRDDQAVRERGRTTRTDVFIVYQVRGDILSIVAGGGSDPAATRRLILHAAHESARSLASQPASG
jgi:hypothetical protein